MNSVENVHELAFVFMDSFDLNVKQRIFVNFNSHVLVNPIGQSSFVKLLDLSPSSLEILIFYLIF